MLKIILIQCANVAIRHDEYLRNFYLRVKRERGHNIAIVATARKMLVCIYYMLKRKGVYNPRLYQYYYLTHVARVLT